MIIFYLKTHHQLLSIAGLFQSFPCRANICNSFCSGGVSPPCIPGPGQRDGGSLGPEGLALRSLPPCPWAWSWGSVLCWAVYVESQQLRYVTQHTSAQLIFQLQSLVPVLLPPSLNVYTLRKWQQHRRVPMHSWILTLLLFAVCTSCKILLHPLHALLIVEIRTAAAAVLVFFLKPVDYFQCWS